MENMVLVPIAETAKVVFNLLFDDESDSDSDDFQFEKLIHSRKRKRRMCAMKPARLEEFVERLLPACSDREFRSHFRMTRPAFQYLVRAIGPIVNTEQPTGRPRMPVEKQILAILWLLATPDCYRSIGNQFDMAKSSLFEAFVRVIKALNTIAPNIIKWPNAEMRREIEQNFRRKAGLHGVIGAVDGTYIPIKAPNDKPEVYINRKCFYGMTLQAICNHRLEFLNCFTGFPSSVSDIRIFRNSGIYAKLMGQRNENQEYYSFNEFIIGDKAYPCLRFCIPPFINRGALTDRQLRFNTAHAKARSVVERSFALLFGRFRRLRYLDMNRTDLIPATIIAACVLHNICLLQDDDLQEYEEEGLGFLRELADNNDVPIVVEPHEQAIADDNFGINLRNLLTANL